MPKSLETIDGEFHKWWESLDLYRRHDIDRQSARSGWRARGWQELESAELKDPRFILHLLGQCEEKLQLYRRASNGEYLGGLEYTRLIANILDAKSVLETIISKGE